MIVLFYSLIAAIVIFIIRSKYWPISYYNGPVSDHFDGKTFFNPNVQDSRMFMDFLKWRYEHIRPTWPKTHEPKQYDAPPPEVKGKKTRVSMVGHATVLIQTQGKNILTDPMWSKRASPFSWIGPKRAVLPGIEFERLPKIDIVIISHNHYDHMDKRTIKNLVRIHNPLFVTPLGNDSLLRRISRKIRVISLDWYQSTKFNKNINIWCYPAQHWSSRWFIDRNKALWGAFIIETNNGNIYFAGDTGYGSGWHFKAALKRFKKFKLAFLPIGAYEPRWFMSYGHIDPFEAVKAMKYLNTKHAIAMHFGAFPMAGDKYDEPPKVLKQALLKERKLDFKLLEVGESIILN